MHRVVSHAVVAVVAAAITAAAITAAGVTPAVADTPNRRVPSEREAPRGFTAVSPSRVLDARTTAPLGPGQTVSLPLAGRGDLPPTGVAAVLLSVTVVSPTAAGYLSIYPGPTPTGMGSLDFAPGQTVANLVVVPVAADGSVQVANSAGSTQVIADVTGWFAPATDDPSDGTFTPVDPTRLLDTRQTVPIPPGGTTTLRVAGSTGPVPRIAGAAILNLTVVGAGSPGTVSVYPGGADPGSTTPAPSNLAYAAGQTVAALTAVRLAADGTVTIRNGSTTPLQVVVDVGGWFRGSTAQRIGTFSFLDPTRVLDTRDGTGGDRAPLGAGLTRVLTVAGRGGVPTTGVAAVVLTVTATDATAPGSVSVFPGGTAPDVGGLRFAAGATVTNLVVVPVRSGAVTIANGSAQAVDVTADVVGFVRGTDLPVPDAGTSHYLRHLTAGQSLTQVRTATRIIGTADGAGAASGRPQLTLLQFGAQTDKAGGNGSGSGRGASALGIRQSATNMRLTYAQVVAAVQGYLDGYVAAGSGRAADTLTVVVGTNSSGFDGASYTPAAKGADWANRVVEPAAAYAKRSAPRVTVVAGDDIEPNFDADIGEVKTWISSYLAAGPNNLVNNGAAVGCPAALGETGRSCLAVPVEHSSTMHTWTQADHYAVSGGLSPSRISVLPQVYVPTQAIQWANVDRTGGGTLTFAGVLTSVSACSTPRSGCTSLSPDNAWTLLSQALASSTATASTAVPAVTDLTVS